jgi:hypothetical protein
MRLKTDEGERSVTLPFSLSRCGKAAEKGHQITLLRQQKIKGRVLISLNPKWAHIPAELIILGVNTDLQCYNNK